MWNLQCRMKNQIIFFEQQKRRWICSIIFSKCIIFQTLKKYLHELSNIIASQMTSEKIRSWSQHRIESKINFSLNAVFMLIQSSVLCESCCQDKTSHQWWIRQAHESTESAWFLKSIFEIDQMKAYQDETFQEKITAYTLYFTRESCFNNKKINCLII